MNQLLVLVLLLFAVLVVIYLVNQMRSDVILMNGGELDPAVFFAKELRALDLALSLYDQGKIFVRFLYPAPIGWVKAPIKGEIPIDIEVDFFGVKNTDLPPDLQPLYSLIKNRSFAKSISTAHKQQIPNLTTDGNIFKRKEPLNWQSWITDTYANVLNRIMNTANKQSRPRYCCLLYTSRCV